ncbi:MAG: ATP-binding protein [Candidatus Zixiibacteriota bacterium]
MIIEFSVSNFRSIGKKQTISFVAAKGDDSLPENVIHDTEPKLLKSIGIYGPNASGKSNIIRALGVMKSIVINSATVKPDVEKPIQSFKLDQTLHLLPTEFEIIFIHNNIRYQYGFVTTKTTVLEEWLIAYPKGYGQTWFRRFHDKKNDEVIFNPGPFLKGEKKRLQKLTRTDSLFLSVAAHFGNKQLKDIYNWFKEYFFVIFDESLDNLPDTELQFSWMHNKDKGLGYLKSVILRYIQNADLGIADIRIRKSDIDVSDITFPDNTPEDVKHDIRNRLKENPPVSIRTVHKIPGTEDEVLFNIEDESDGTQRFIELLGPWLWTKFKKATLIVDEIESGLHPLLTRELIKLIHNESENSPSPQLLFTTHDVTLLSNDLLRRDQIWFVEKDEKQESVLTPLTDYSPRNKEALLKGYMSGRYRAIPNLDDFGKDET